MAELVNLRTARKQAKRRRSDQLADANRLKHGQRKDLREFEDAKQKKAARTLDQHRLDSEDGR
jgi:Domain of unknown function (DUF4169)